MHPVLAPKLFTDMIKLGFKGGHTLGNISARSGLRATCCTQQYHAELGNILRAHPKVAIGIHYGVS